MKTSASVAPVTAAAVNRLVPFVHVASVDASLAFYAFLGFTPVNVMKDARGVAFWAMAKSGGAEIMFARADGPVDAAQQAVLFYMYSDDVAGVRQRLLAGGLHDGERYNGVSAPHDGRRVVFDLAHPAHMPAGELRVQDSDGYVVLVGQLA